jgi:alpha-1,4-digalacturonate transport system permease protein
MLLVNSMAAFALSKYQFRGRTTVLLLVIGTLMIPQTVVLVPLFLIVTELGMFNSLWGVIIPGAATPTGRLPAAPIHADHPRRDPRRRAHGQGQRVEDLLADHHAALGAGHRGAGDPRHHVALERLSLAADRADPVENFTLQLALNSFQGELLTDWSSLLAMTVLTLLPIALVFMFLQKYIATGIASREEMSGAVVPKEQGAARNRTHRRHPRGGLDFGLPGARPCVELKDIRKTGPMARWR